MTAERIIVGLLILATVSTFVAIGAVLTLLEALRGVLQ